MWEVWEVWEGEWRECVNCEVILGQGVCLHNLVPTPQLTQLADPVKHPRCPPPFPPPLPRHLASLAPLPPLPPLASHLAHPVEDPQADSDLVGEGGVIHAGLGIRVGQGGGAVQRYSSTAEQRGVEGVRL